MASTRDRPHIRVRPWHLLALAGTAPALSTVIGFLGAVWWPFDMFAHFRMQYLVSLGLLAVLLLALRRWRPALALVAFAVPNLICVAPLFLGPDTPAVPADAPRLRVMMINVHFHSRNAAAVLRAVEEANPDLIAFLEIGERWVEDLAPLEKIYPHRATRPLNGVFGIGLYSKLPFENAEILSPGVQHVPAIRAVVRVRGRRLVVFTAHPSAPASPGSIRSRDKQMAALPAAFGLGDDPFVLIADLNATRWSYPFRKLLRESGLRDSALGYGWQPTWPAHNPLMRIAIDHCLYSEGVEVLDRRPGPRVGSDHWPLIVDLAVTGGTTPTPEEE